VLTILPLPASTALSSAEDSPSAFSRSRACFESLVTWAESAEAGELTHGELEEHLEEKGREVMRTLLQDHVDLRAQRAIRGRSGWRAPTGWSGTASR
jgi:hypothetical protein